MMHIPQEAQRVINQYKHIRVGAHRFVRCPYYRNPRSGKERWGLNAFSGKGTPEEIEHETHIIEKLENAHFDNLSDEEVRDIMRKRRLGIECSGFIAHVLDAWTRQTRGKRIFHVLAFPRVPPWKKIVIWLRPFTHIDIATLTHRANAQEFTDWSDVRPGDLIRFNTDIDHAILVTDVSDGTIQYVHSVKEESGVGIKDGTITGDVWQETPDTGTTIRERGTTPKLYHPRFLIP